MMTKLLSLHSTTGKPFILVRTSSSSSSSSSSLLVSFLHLPFFSALFLQVLQGILALFGLISYTTNFISAFRSSASLTRKVADVVGFLLFLTNLALAIGFVAPAEAAIGSKFTQKGSVVSTEEVDTLLRLHFVYLGVVLLLAVQQMISFKSQGEASSISKDKKTR